MTTVGVKVDHVALTKALEQVELGLPDELGRGVLRAAQYTSGIIRRTAPLITGQLRRSFRESFLGRTGLAIGAASLSDLVYAGVVDEGGTINRISKNGRAHTAIYRGRFYLRESEQQAATGVERIIAAAVERVTSKR